jgi:hypothetical protein
MLPLSSTMQRMVLGGAITSGWAWVAILPSGTRTIVVLAFTGGVVAWLISRRWECFVLGAIAYAVAALWIRPWVGDEAAALGGWLASATVGLALTLTAPDRTDPQEEAARTGAPLPIAVVGIVSVAGWLGLLWWSASYQERTTASLSTRAEEAVDATGGGSERLPFRGDGDEAGRTADQIRLTLASLVAASPVPDEVEVHQALTPWARSNHSVEVSTRVVPTSGTGFGVRTPGGCIFGSVDHGTVQVEVGGYVDRGGCLDVDGP